MKKQKIALVLGLLIAGCSRGQSEQTGIAQSKLVTQTVYSNGVLTSGWRDTSNATHTLNSGTVLHGGLRTVSVTYKPYK